MENDTTVKPPPSHDDQRSLSKKNNHFSDIEVDPISPDLSAPHEAPPRGQPTKSMLIDASLDEDTMLAYAKDDLIIQLRDNIFKDFKGRVLSNWLRECLQDWAKQKQAERQLELERKKALELELEKEAKTKELEQKQEAERISKIALQVEEEAIKKMIKQRLELANPTSGTGTDDSHVSATVADNLKNKRKDVPTNEDENDDKLQSTSSTDRPTIVPFKKRKVARKSREGKSQDDIHEDPMSPSARQDEDIMQDKSSDEAMAVNSHRFEGANKKANDDIENEQEQKESTSPLPPLPLSAATPTKPALNSTTAEASTHPVDEDEPPPCELKIFPPPIPKVKKHFVDSDIDLSIPTIATPSELPPKTKYDFTSDEESDTDAKQPLKEEDRSNDDEEQNQTPELKTLQPKAASKTVKTKTSTKTSKPKAQKPEASEKVDDSARNRKKTLTKSFSMSLEKLDAAATGPTTEPTDVESKDNDDCNTNSDPATTTATSAADDTALDKKNTSIATAAAAASKTAKKTNKKTSALSLSASSSSPALTHHDHIPIDLWQSYPSLLSKFSSIKDKDIPALPDVNYEALFSTAQDQWQAEYKQLRQFLADRNIENPLLVARDDEDLYYFGVAIDWWRKKIRSSDLMVDSNEG